MHEGLVTERDLIGGAESDDLAVEHPGQRVVLALADRPGEVGLIVRGSESRLDRRRNTPLPPRRYASGLLAAAASAAEALALADR